MSNAELKQLNERMQLEQNYSRLNPTKVEKGRQYLMGAATLTGTALTLYNNSDKIAKLGRAGATFVKGAIRR